MPHEASEAKADRGATRWLVAAYRPVTLFSLRMTHATNKGGKTLVVPTPYSIKMTLLDACFRRWEGPGAERRARAVFDWFKGCDVRVRPPEDALVQHTFVKILDWARYEKGESGPPFKQTIAYREFVYFRGDLEIAISLAGLTDESVRALRELMPCVQTLGKRGGFFQFVGDRLIEGEPVGAYTRARGDVPPAELPRYGMSQALDDFGEALCTARDGFDRISTYGGGKVLLDKHRILRLTAVPYIRRASSRRFTWYKRSDAESGEA